MNSMGVDNQSKHKLMADIVTMMMTSETNLVVPITVNPILQILQQDNVASMNSSDDDDSESDMCQQCVSEITSANDVNPKFLQMVTILMH